jgi:Family of unknown function (DUF5689)/Secretion system C-terminal sorting domain
MTKLLNNNSGEIVMKKICILLAAIFTIVNNNGEAFAQLLMENFDYGATPGELIAITPNWTVHSGTGVPVQYQLSGLTYNGYLGSEIGGSVAFAGGSGSRQDINALLNESVATSSNIYVSFLVNLITAGTNDYFFHLGPHALGTTFRARVFARDTSSGTGWALGLSKSSEVATLDTSTILNYNQSYLIIMKYEFNTSASDDDQVTLYAYDSGVPSSEPGSPIVTIGPIGAGVSSDPSDIGTVAIRQGGSSTAGTIDGIKVGTSWNFIAAASNTLPIDSLRVNDSNGSPVRLNDTVNTTGIVTAVWELGTETSGPGAIQNDSVGISIVGNAFAQTEEVKRGDSVLVENWKITQVSGLTELGYTSTSNVKILSSGHNVTPLVITIPEIKKQDFTGIERYESRLIQINSIRFVQSGVLDVGASPDAIYQIYSGQDTLDLRIIKTNTSLLGKNIPTGDLNVVGVLTQYCSSAPYAGGYQLLPRDSADITTLTAVEDNESKLYKHQLYQNYPNPFNPSTTISYYIPTEENVVLKLFNVLGQEIKTLINERQTAGQHGIKFFANNISSGIYFYRLTAGSFSISKKMIIMK